MEDTLSPIIVEARQGKTASPYSVLVYEYAFKQYRIQITDPRVPTDGSPEGHGDIKREMCTYKAVTMVEKFTALVKAKDPLALAETWATPTNCEYRGGRIRLDQ